MSKGSIVGASHKISAKSIDHSLAEMEWRFTNRNIQHMVRETLVRIPNTDPMRSRSRRASVSRTERTPQ